MNQQEDFELTLFDRLEVIKQTIRKHGEDKFYISFSGGKDSTILHYLVDMAIPENQIPRVFIDTGIEYNAIREFVKNLALVDKRFQIIRPSQPIKEMLEINGYPFKSKEHSVKVGMYQKGSRSKSIIAYKEGNGRFSCPNKLLYQFEKDFKLRLSSDCCTILKKKPVHKWEKENKRHIAIIGIRMEEGGQRKNHKGCIAFKGGKVTKFKPLNPVSNEFEEWFIEKFQIKLCKLYYPPYNFKRTGCKGCPFSLDLQDQLTAMQTYMPAERQQCEIIWKPVYDEYRRIKYRLNKDEQIKLL